MAKSISDNTKRGRPVTTGIGTLIGVRLHPPQLAALDSWIVKQGEPLPTRPEALRRLAEIGLTARDFKHHPKSAGSVEGKQGKTGNAQTAAAKARDMASRAIDMASDKSASAEEQDRRKQKLIKRPPKDVK